MYAERLSRLTTSHFLLLSSIFVRRMNSSSTPLLSSTIFGKTVPGPFRRAAPSTITFKNFLESNNIEFEGATDSETIFASEILGRTGETAGLVCRVDSLGATDVLFGGVGMGFWVEGGKGANSSLESENLTNMGLETKWFIELIETLIL